MDALVDLVNKDNIIVMDSFFGEFTLYYLSYLQHFLFLRKKALIVVSSDNQVKQVVTQYEKIFLHINKVYPIWKICDFSNMPDEKTGRIKTDDKTIESIDKKTFLFFKKITSFHTNYFV